ncbi:MAG: hypothetical protein KIT00_01230 [Rhodospirillales bacterium]|nr:hypothetical protein [Rhodospirillales bacterium]
MGNKEKFAKDMRPMLLVWAAQTISLVSDSLDIDDTKLAKELHRIAGNLRGLANVLVHDAQTKNGGGTNDMSENDVSEDFAAPEERNSGS